MKNDSIDFNIPAINAESDIRFKSCTFFTANDFIICDYPQFCTDFPLVITETNDAAEALRLKLKLQKYFSHDYILYMLWDGKADKIKLNEIDKQQNYRGAVFYFPPADLLDKKRFVFSDLLKIMKRLRGEGGCPWDREQTHESIKMNAVEEAYEIIEAIDNNNMEALKEEIGDLLLQPVFQSRIAEDNKEFDIYDVISTLCGKLIYRHSHIFGHDKAENSRDALITWEKNKNTEKNQDTYTKSLKGVAKTFPSLTRAEKVQKRAAKCGFDFEKAEEVFAKLYEEIAELKEAVVKNDNKEMLKEGGDLLFSVVNLLRKIGIDGEIALNNSTDKFIKRFEYMENSINKSGKTLDEVSLKEMEKYYTESKERISGTNI
jgi:tetrapyrrole methylase family protein/MazG family protein